jgi:hypothetical protein
VFGFLLPTEIATEWEITDDKIFTYGQRASHQRNESVGKTV